MTNTRTTIVLFCTAFLLSIIAYAHTALALCIGSAGAFCDRGKIAKDRCAAAGLRGDMYKLCVLQMHETLNQGERSRRRAHRNYMQNYNRRY